MMSFDHQKRCRNEKSDRISQLPQPLILEILSRLPLGDSARASILSKTWKSFCSSYPILYFDHNLFALRHLVYAEEGGEERDINQIRDMFMDHVDNHLSKASQLESSIRKLALTVAINDSIYFTRVDKLLELVRQINVEDLCIFVQNAHPKWRFVDCDTVLYQFPVSLLSSKGLRSVYVRGCKLTYETIVGQVSFSSLQRLCLSHVYINDGGVENLARCCQGIEMLEFDKCVIETTFLDLSQFPKLKKAVIASTGCIDYVGIVGTNLECFKYHIDYKTECLISPEACAGIRDLTLRGCTVDQSHLLKDLTATFPLLEQVKLFIYDTDTLKAANDALRKITFRSQYLDSLKKVHINCPNLTLLDCTTHIMTELYVDCPRLRVFRYCGTTVPERLFFRAADDLEESNLIISVNYAYDTLWFINLRAFLVFVMANRPTYLSLYVTLPMATFDPEEVELIPDSPRYNVHLTLIIACQDMPNIAPLVDALLWVVRPTTFVVSSTFHHPIQYLCENLMKKSQDDMSTYPCWLHQLEDFQVESSFDIPNIKENLMALPEQCPTRITNVCFKFQWACNKSKLEM